MAPILGIGVAFCFLNVFTSADCPIGNKRHLSTPCTLCALVGYKSSATPCRLDIQRLSITLVPEWRLAFVPAPSCQDNIVLESLAWRGFWGLAVLLLFCIRETFRNWSASKTDKHVVAYRNCRTKFLPSPNSGTRVGAVFPIVDVRHMRAVIVLAEELNFTRAADRLHITQPALSKQMAGLEDEQHLHLFARDTRGAVELTDAGRTFVEASRSALQHTERVGHLARAVQEGADSVLTIGLSPCADGDWISTMFAIRLALYPKLRIRLETQFAMESVRSVLVGELNLALVTAPPQDGQITVVPFASTPLYAALPENHPAADKERLLLQDLAEDDWILVAKRVHPRVRDAVMDTARRASIVPKHAHDVMTAHEAVDLVSRQVGTAIIAHPMARPVRAEGVVVKPLCDTSLCFETCLIMRANEQSRLVNEFARSFLRKCAPKRLPPTQLELPLTA